MIKLTSLFSLVGSTLLAATAFAAPPKVLFYAPFDGSINATIAGGNAQGIPDKGKTMQFVPGISGQGLLSGAPNQRVTFSAKDNIPSDQWTITFWMKGLPGAKWNNGSDLQTFWQLGGTNGQFMWFYKYTNRGPWLLSRRAKDGSASNDTFRVPAAPEEEWHYWAMTWQKGGGTYVYLDGKLVGQSPCEPPDQVTSISVGQISNPAEQNKVIDEFKIYDGALDAASIAQYYWQEGNFALNPEMTVTPTRHKITIDGKIDVDEWREATGVSGLVDAKSRKIEVPQTSARLTYDEQNLYLAMHSDNPPEMKDHPDTVALYGIAKRDAVKHDIGVQDDDHFFIQIQPNSNDKKYFSVLVNAIDTTADFVSSDRENDDSWQSGVKTKSIMTDKGWSMEAAIPLKSLGINNIANDMTWRINLGRVWKLLRQRTDVWAAGERIGDQEPTIQAGFGDVHFANSPGGIVNLQAFTIGPDGDISGRMRLMNPNNAPRNVNVSISAAGKVLSEQEISLVPNDYNHGAALSGLPVNALGDPVEITVKSDEKVLLRQAVPLILQQVGHLELWSYPSTQQVRIGWVVQSNEKPEDLNLAVQIKNTDGQIIKQAKEEKLQSLRGSSFIDINALPVGKYLVEAQISKDKETLQRQTLTWEKSPTPSWLGNQLGISEVPPTPWTNVKVDKAKDAISIWGRTYDYAKHLLPAQIINQGKPMLSAPMQIVAKSGNDTQTTNVANTDASWTETTAKRATSLRKQTIGNIKLTADSYTEYDGMSWINLTVAPQKEKVLLDNLTFEIPIKKEWAELLRPADDYMLHQTGKIPEKGWTSKAISMPWIGNGDGGIQFLLENTAGWTGSKNIEILPNDNGSVVMRVHLVDEKITLDKPLQFAFGWMASPVKAAPQTARDWRLIGSSTSAKEYIKQAATTNPKIQWYQPWWQGWWWLPEAYKGNPDHTGSLPVPAKKDQKNAIRDYFGAKVYAAAYGRLSQIGTENPWFKQFQDEWVPDAAKYISDKNAVSPRRMTPVSQASESLRDFFAWGYNDLLSDDNVHALYFDVSRPINDSNTYRGAGVLSSDGSIEPSYNILGTRKVLERIYTLMKEKHPDGRVFYHTSGQTILPVISFADGLVDGENTEGRLDRKDNRGYEKILSVDLFNAEYGAQNNFGSASLFLPQFGRAKSITSKEWEEIGYQHADYLLGLILLHDSNLWWTWMPTDHLTQIYSGLDATGLNSTWKFIPYWQQKYFSTPEGTYASFYQSADGKKVLLVAMNTSGKNVQMEIPPTLDESIFTTAKAVYPGQELSVENGKVSIAVEDNNFATILLSK